MFIIDCPYCGERDQTEFTCHGEAHIARPSNPNEVSNSSFQSPKFRRAQIRKNLLDSISELKRDYLRRKFEKQNPNLVRAKVLCNF